MKFWKCDTEIWTVRQVEGDIWPGKDEEGDVCYENTHFDDENKAWAALKREAEAMISLLASRIQQLNSELSDAQKKAGEAVIAMSTLNENYKKRFASEKVC